MIKLIIFDLWETLIQNTIDWPHVKSIMKNNGLEYENFIRRYEKSTQMKEFSSLKELKKSFFKEFVELDEESLERSFYELFLNRFDKIKFFHEVPSILENLSKKYKLALLSNTEAFHFKEISQQLKLENYFDGLFPSFKIQKIKPDPDAFKIILSYFQVSPEETLMVGDSIRSDVGGAQNLNIHSCWVNREKKKPKKVNPEFEITSFTELPNILSKIN
jgi:2-haloalkanoic acid dehalogenase type II